MQMPYVAGIFIYPIKSLDPVAVERVTILPGGAMQQDREYAIADAQGRFVNGKRNAKVHKLRSFWDTATTTISLQIQDTDEKRVFHLEESRSELEAWLSDYFGFGVHLIQNQVTGFPDDTNATGPTVISTATIATVASWFPPISVEEMRSRLRANIEIADVPPFWEDRLFGEDGEIFRFQIGQVLFEGVNPCQRCIVPTRNSQTGAGDPNFQKIFVEGRRETLPSWTVRSRFNHFYRLSVNTRIPPSEAGKAIEIGDDLNILSTDRQ
jgi:uncharacterized protein